MQGIFVFALMAAIFGAVGLGRNAQARVTYDFVFRSTDRVGNAIAGGTANGATFTFDSATAARACDVSTGAGCPVIDLFVKNGVPLIGTALTMVFDNSRGLAAGGAVQWTGIGVVFNMNGDAVRRMIPGGLPEIRTDRVGFFDGDISPPNGPPSLPTGTYNLGSILWDTSSVAGTPFRHTIMTGGLPFTVFTTGLLNGVKRSFTGTETLTSGFIEVIPEPATAGLLGGGLFVLALAFRRRVPPAAKRQRDPRPRT